MPTAKILARSEAKKSPKPIASDQRLKFIKKRDGSIMPFDKTKIATAIGKALRSVGLKENGKPQRYAERVVALLKETLAATQIPTVEGVQDIVEKVLLESGEVRLAREYISYREKRATLRKEKQQILEKEAIDEVDKLFDINALRVLKSRYLAKDENGKLVEGPKQLFERVSIHAYVPSLLYDKSLFRKEGGEKIHTFEEFDSVKNENKVAIGPYKLNRWHLESLKTLYDRLNQKGQMRVTWSHLWQMFLAGNFARHETEIRAFYEEMKNKRFLPNTPALANFGRSLGMGSACFVLDIKDSMESIMGTLYTAAIIFKSGGGLGYNFSHLRPEGDVVRSTSGVASGPISFMSLYDKMTDVIKQGGIRRGANMGILNSNHPDIEKFVTAKKGNKALRNFNISVLVMPEFWQCYKKNKDYPLVNPRTGKVDRLINARTLFDLIVYQAWESAEPGIIFYDKVNDYNPFLESLGPIETTNPCGEVLLYPNESCNLGSLNVHTFARKDEKGKSYFDWVGLKDTIFRAVEFLDNVIDVNKFPTKEIEEMSLNTRKVGLGVMGLADALFALRIPYDSREGLRFMDELAEFINFASKLASIELAKVRGAFPYFEKSFFTKGRLPIAGFESKKSWRCEWQEIPPLVKTHGIRNSYTTVIAPTGSISMIAGTSSGIEPVFSLVYEKNVAVGSFYYIDEEFEQAMKEFGIYDEGLSKDIVAHQGSLQHISYLPNKIKRVFKVAHDLQPESHIKALATFQRWVDSSISKTINFPQSATVEDMKKAYLLAYKLGCKDITVYRDSSLENQVLSSPGGSSAKSREDADLPLSKIENGTSGGKLGKCPECQTDLVKGEGCIKCPNCGWGLCA
ncbi:MAG: adenosylcobalamin-dependent ribonucleoside-diphosphate reductase [Parcubacteria group bacterium]|nr:adenosylcobalamin-dependent ribonucleoside-diphosphate reductase [Parcubacteria group bacterium]